MTQTYSTEEPMSSKLGFVSRRSSGTLPVVRTKEPPKKKGVSPISSPKLVEKWEYRALDNDGQLTNGETNAVATEAGEETSHQIPLFYHKMQALVQMMLHSESGVRIRSHRNKLLTAVPSVFTGSDLINWISTNLLCSKSEALHIAILIYKHGYFYSVDRDELQIKEDSTLFRFQTPHLWPSQSFDDSDYTYSIFLLKQFKMSIRRKGYSLADYQVSSLRRLQDEFKSQWDEINAKADEEARILKDQKKMARHLITCQERAFWRLRRPPPGEAKVTDSFLTRFAVERRKKDKGQVEEEATLAREVECLKGIINSPRQQLTTSLDSIVQNCKKYSSYDPMLKTPPHSNPWTTNDESPWVLQRSLVECPTERRVKKWSCSFEDLLKDVTGRYNFEKFCKKQYSSENIKFWQAVQDLKMLPLAAVPGAVALIYDEFIDPNAASMVNLSAKAKAEAEKDLLNPSRYSFSHAQNDVYKLMETDIYPRFLKTDYEALLKAGSTTGSVGRNFLKKLISRNAASRQDRTSPVEIASPCHPLRYTKRQLSISKPSQSAGSMDNIFMMTGNDSSTNAPEFKQSHSNPSPNHLLSPDEHVPQERRVSAPILSFKSRNSTPSPSGLSRSSKSPSPTSPSYSDHATSTELEPVNEEEHQPRVKGVKKMKEDRQSSTERALQHSVMFSRSMEDLSNLAEEDDGMNLAMHKDTFQMGLMSLRSPEGGAFNFLDGPNLDNKFDNTYNLFNDPEASFSPSFMSSIKKNRGTGVRPSLASLGVNMMTIPVPKLGYQGNSSNESINSTISAI